MKFISLILGLCGATGVFACPWCKVSKESRGDTSKSYDFYNSEQMARTLAEINSCASKKLYGVKNLPLINIELCHVIPDELHMLMRIFDVLLRNLIDDAKDKDDIAKLKKETGDYLETLVEKIRSCGVTFNIWQPRYGKGEIDWSSMTGEDVKKVLNCLPDKLVFVVHNETLDETMQIWREFRDLYRYLCSTECETKSVEYTFNKCKRWIDLFLSLSEKRKGYQPENITPYMHCLTYHVPLFVSKYGSLRKYSGQTVEKANDNIKRIYHQKINRSDCTVDSLKVRKRIEFCSRENLQREKRDYTKRDKDYWEFDIREKRVSKKQRIIREIKETNDNYLENKKQTHEEIENLDECAIKQKLSLLGIKTRVRKKEKLVELLRDALRDTE